MNKKNNLSFCHVQPSTMYKKQTITMEKFYERVGYIARFTKTLCSDKNLTLPL